MMTPEQRSELIDALSGLADDDDSAALAAARKTSETMAGLNSSWDELLITAEPEADEETAPPTREHAPDEQLATPEECQHGLKLIESLMSRKSLFQGTRAELRGYKEDIAAGELQSDDLRYLKALSRRLQRSG